jgi:hypothetical protein
MALAAIFSAPAFADPDAALAKLQETVLSKGPSGEDPSPASSVVLTDDELAKIKSMGATAAIVMHYGGNDWSRAQINGLQTQFAAMGIKVIAVTDAGFKPPVPIAPQPRRGQNWCSWTMCRPALCPARTTSPSSRLTTTATVSRPRI